MSRPSIRSSSGQTPRPGAASRASGGGQTNGRAISLDGERQIHLEAARTWPAASAEEVKIRVLGALITRLDVETCRGMFDHTGVIGHQVVGELIECSNRSASERIGRRVVIDPVIRCGQCDRCRTGMPTHCRDRVVCGICGRDGALAEYALIPISNVHDVPRTVADEHAVFAVLAGSALQVKRQISVERRPFITVLGDGPLGLLTGQALVSLNATVRVIGRFSEKMKHCERWGLKHRHIDDIGRRADQDVVVDCSGEPAGLAMAMRLVRSGGTIVVKTLAPTASWQASEAVDWSILAANEIRVLGSFFGSVREGLAAIARGELKTEGLITRRMRLGDGADILREAARPESLSVFVDVAG